MAAVRAGLALDLLREHTVAAVWAARSPRAGKYLDWPMLLWMRLVAADVNCRRQAPMP
jgi:hypothetical protein